MYWLTTRAMLNPDQNQLSGNIIVLLAKVMALTCVDLLYDKAKLAKEITKNFKTSIPPGDYEGFMRKLVA
ncbi:hypothetical protein A3K78_00515 [Candidatus Bathyarchaeota archaeon RBG_13_52_12]|nr:MAG: hypothetical protein A3K78_00515 [Candidatus Bathyarchaeota archaeon RBG_13_52_12]